MLFLWLIGPVALIVGAYIAYLFFTDWQRTKLQRQINPEYEWHRYESETDLMRRRAIDGTWQYRAMTGAEFQKYKSDRW